MVKTEDHDSFSATVKEYKQLTCIMHQMVAEMRFPYNAFNKEPAYCDEVTDEFIKQTLDPARKK